ncbi:MAG: hypothetical protein IJW86_01570 [Clostridia bacterium]|nr:hypothetical protein [Clostridia bacterium]
MNEKDILLSHALDVKEKCADNSVITSTNFMSLEEISTVKTAERQFSEYVTTFYYGGYEDAERRIALFVPKFYDVGDIEDYLKENEDENPLCILRLKKDKFTTLSHRDYLGSVMGLGIKREMTGDIKVSDEGADIFCLKSIASFLCENLKKAGRGSLEGEIQSVQKYNAGTEKTEIKFYSVASLRLDNIISAAFNLSRGTAAEAISKGIVYVNSSQCLKNDFTLKQGDKIVFRGKGKVVLYEVIGENKKGRVHINLKRYI